MRVMLLRVALPGKEPARPKWCRSEGGHRGRETGSPLGKVRIKGLFAVQSVAAVGSSLWMPLPELTR